MPDQSNAERRSWTCALGVCLALADRLRHRRRPGRGRARGGGEELRPRGRGIHQGASRQPRRRQRPAGARSRQAARGPGSRISCSHARRRRALRRSARRVSARVGAEPQRYPRGRSAARRASEAPHQDRGDAQRKNRARIVDRAISRACRRQGSICRPTRSFPTRSSSAPPAAAMCSDRSRSLPG